MSKVSLKLVKGNSYISDGFLSIGVYIHNKHAVLIDSGNDESCAKDLNNALQLDGYEVVAIINTHCHPDHCGGNYYYQKKFPNLKIYSTHDEKEFIQDPHLAPRCFCAGAAAFAGLKNKYIAPQKSSLVTNVITYQDHDLLIDDVSFKIITLPGHTPGSIGIITSDNILYSGDALFGKETFNKHPILFYTDISNTLASLAKLAALKVDACVLYHGGIIYNLSEIAHEHIIRILETKDFILSLLEPQPLSIDLLTQKIMQSYKIANNIISFTLTQTTIRAYLTYLELNKSIELIVDDGLLQAIKKK